MVEFIKENPLEIKGYLAEKAKMWDEARKLNLPEVTAKLERYRAARKSA